VLAAADDLGYAPSALAQALVQRTSRIIGVIVNDIVDPYFAEIARGVEDVAGRMGYLVMVCNADRRPEAELEYVRALREYHALGIVFAGSGTPENAANAALDAEVGAAGARVVALAQREFPAHLVHVDNAAAAFEVTEHLLSLGHRRIAFVDGPEGLATSMQRARGFEAAMGAAGLPGDLRLAGGFDFESGVAAGGELLGTRPLPDAVLAANDEAAIGVLTALRHAGIDVPGEISVAGIDDTRPARFVELTTVNLPLHDLGAVAARHILAGADEPAGEVVLPHRLVPRRTTSRRA